MVVIRVEHSIVMNDDASLLNKITWYKVITGGIYFTPIGNLSFVRSYY